MGEWNHAEQRLNLLIFAVHGIYRFWQCCQRLETQHRGIAVSQIWGLSGVNERSRNPTRIPPGSASLVDGRQVNLYMTPTGGAGDMQMRGLGVIVLLVSLLAFGYYVLQILDEANSDHGWSGAPKALIGVALGLGLLAKEKSD